MLRAQFGIEPASAGFSPRDGFEALALMDGKVGVGLLGSREGSVSVRSRGRQPQSRIKTVESS